MISKSPAPGAREKLEAAIDEVFSEKQRLVETFGLRYDREEIEQYPYGWGVPLHATGQDIDSFALSNALSEISMALQDKTELFVVALFAA